MDTCFHLPSSCGDSVVTHRPPRMHATRLMHLLREADKPHAQANVAKGRRLASDIAPISSGTSCYRRPLVFAFLS